MGSSLTSLHICTLRFQCVHYFIHLFCRSFIHPLITKTAENCLTRGFVNWPVHIQGDWINEHAMGGCRMHGKYEKCLQTFDRWGQREDHLGNLNVNRMITLKCILKEKCVKMRIGSSVSTIDWCLLTRLWAFGFLERWWSFLNSLTAVSFPERTVLSGISYQTTVAVLTLWSAVVSACSTCFNIQ
jgi:hypothetical protein